MKPFRLLFLILLAATATLANNRNWKPARVIDASETDVSSDVHGEKHTMHYTVQTEDNFYFLDYTYKPSQHESHPPNLAVNVLTKIAIEGKHAYILDANDKELKLQIVKKPTKK
jgi:hypothetical protein